MRPHQLLLPFGMAILLLLAAAPPVAAQVTTTLSVEQADSQDPARVGKKLTYTFTVENLGPDAAPDVSLTVDLPGDACPGCPVVMEFERARTSAGTCADPAETIVVCRLGTIDVGEAVTVRITIVPRQAGTLVDRGYATLGADPFTSYFAADETTLVVG